MCQAVLDLHRWGVQQQIGPVWNVLTSMLSGVPESINREPLESSLLTTWPFWAGRPSANTVQRLLVSTESSKIKYTQSPNTYKLTASNTFWGDCDTLLSSNNDLSLILTAEINTRCIERPNSPLNWFAISTDMISDRNHKLRGNSTGFTRQDQFTISETLPSLGA